MPGRKTVAPERLEPRIAPGVMLPLLPVLELPLDESVTVEQVEPLDASVTKREFLSAFETGQESFSTAVHDLVLNGLSFSTVDETVDAATAANRSSVKQDFRLAAGFVFDRMEATRLVVEELTPQLATLSAALPAAVAEENSPTPNNTPVSVAVPATSAPPSAVAASAPRVGTVADVAPPATHVRTTPVTSVQQPTTSSTPVVAAATEAIVAAPSLPNLTPTEVVTPVAENSAPVATIESTPTVAIDPVATPAQPVVTPVVELPATPAGVVTTVAAVSAPAVVPIAPVVTTVVESAAVSTVASNSVATVLASFAADTETEETSTKQITETDVELLLSRATQVTNSEDAIIAIVDRGGHILGVHVEQGVLDTITDMDTLVFAIDGAVAKARTAAFFSNDQAPLTSRTVRFISQSTVTQREVQSNPNVADETLRGPGFVAPIGLGGHFPPDVLHTPHVDLFAIEHTNRDSLVHPGPNRIKEAATVDDEGRISAAGGDDILLGSRFGANFVDGQEIDTPESYGVVSGTLTSAQSRGIATLPGGVPLYKLNHDTNAPELVGGIGVFFPGADGQADFEQGFVPGVGQTTGERTNANRVLEAEYIAAVTALNTATLGDTAPVPHFVLRPGRIDLVGITLEGIGPHPGTPAGFLAQMGSRFATGTETGTRMPVTPGGATAIAGEAVPEGWLVNPTASADGSLSAAAVEKIITDGITEANLVRSAIRLPLGTRSKMVLSVADQEGTILGLFRMPDSTFFSIDVAVAKARNVVYYADPADLLSVDQVDFAGDGTPDIPAGTALTNRTFRFLAEPRFPSGVDGSTPPPFSILRDPGIDPRTGENLGAPTPASSFTSVLGFDAFNPASNFREPVPDTGFQNGVVFFPGSTPLYTNTTLLGGFGVSGDGVDQDDVVTFSGAGEFLPRRGSGATRADEVFVDGVRLPYQKFLRNPRG